MAKFTSTPRSSDMRDELAGGSAERGLGRDVSTTSYEYPTDRYLLGGPPDFDVRPRSNATVLCKPVLYRKHSLYIYMQVSNSPLKNRGQFDAQPSPVGVFANHSIWLLDDDASMLKALGRLLISAGFNVEKFNHPAAFLARLHEAGCRVAVVDVWMPGMNGLEVQAFLGKVSRDTRIIFISGRDEPSVRQTALAAGAFGFLAKPFEDEALIQLVRQALSGSNTSNRQSGDMP